jgi:hypothetical protein
MVGRANRFKRCFALLKRLTARSQFGAMLRRNISIFLPATSQCVQSTRHGNWRVTDFVSTNAISGGIGLLAWHFVCLEVCSMSYVRGRMPDAQRAAAR